MKLVECVPNFSEGRDSAVLDAIAAAIASVQSVKLLDVDPGEDTNRTVVTFIGSPEGVVEAAFQAIRTAAELIDMRTHTGAHARMGATDVCPFVPVSGVTMEDCVALANALGQRVGEELNIPVYLYEEAARKPERRNLAVVRRGEYEGLPEKLADPNWQPDFGPALFNPRSGATVVGAREFLIAYNVNLNTKDRKLAHDIALTIREGGRAKKDIHKRIIRDENGKAIKIPGKLRACKAVGWYIDEYRMAQISINLVNYNVTPPHMAFETIREEASVRGLRVTGSELVGLIPKEAMLMAGRYYLRRQGKSAGVPEEELIRVAVHSLGLNEIAPFDPRQKIIEYQFGSGPQSLTGKSLREFSDEVSTDSPAPGGGSVAALSGALSASLSAMVANLTHGKGEYESAWSLMEEIACEAQRLKDFFLDAVEEDTAAFNRVMDAHRLPKKTEEEKKHRVAAIDEATKEAARVPLRVMEKALETLELAKTVAEKGNVNSVSDAGVSAIAAKAAVDGAALNVLINLGSIEDQKFVKSCRKDVAAIQKTVAPLVEEILACVSTKMNADASHGNL
ncbi:MAG: glutamate formimidoyltransferase [Gemmatimonadota bacterium]|nr:MAG: glutamate formimidoyltransferase [Gemmatimonadota bacterium]